MQDEEAGDCGSMKTALRVWGLFQVAETPSPGKLDTGISEDYRGPCQQQAMEKEGTAKIGDNSNSNNHHSNSGTTSKSSTNK